MFHAQNPGVAMQVDVTRRPYSFRGVRTPVAEDPSSRTWAENLKNHYPGYYENGEFCTLRRLGQNANIDFDFDTKFTWQPVDSQRMLMLAMSKGLGEVFAESLAKRHFEQRKSVAEASWLLEAAEEAGLDAAEATALLASDKYEKEVWDSYARNVALGITSIPLFMFWPPGAENFGPFRSSIDNENTATMEEEPEPYVINGSADPGRFLEVFEAIAAANIPLQE